MGNGLAHTSNCARNDSSDPVPLNPQGFISVGLVFSRLPTPSSSFDIVDDSSSFSRLLDSIGSSKSVLSNRGLQSGCACVVRRLTAGIESRRLQISNVQEQVADGPAFVLLQQYYSLAI